MNLNTLLLTNIQSSPYFKVNLYELKTYHEVIDEIYYKVSEGNTAYLFIFLFMLVNLYIHKKNFFVMVHSIPVNSACIWQLLSKYVIFAKFLDNKEMLTFTAFTMT